MNQRLICESKGAAPPSVASIRPNAIRGLVWCRHVRIAPTDCCPLQTGPILDGKQWYAAVVAVQLVDEQTHTVDLTEVCERTRRYDSSEPLACSIMQQKKVTRRFCSPSSSTLSKPLRMLHEIFYTFRKVSERRRGDSDGHKGS